jgi:tetratricopeptide (TPR) repeat protein
MGSKGKPPSQNELTSVSGGALVRAGDQEQLDFEIDFFTGILERHPNYLDVLRVHGNNLTLRGRYLEGLQIDKRLVNLRPSDALAHYNLACSFALLRKKEQSLKALRQAIELGYRDFRYILEDRDLENIRSDPRFRQLLREFNSV